MKSTTVAGLLNALAEKLEGFAVELRRCYPSASQAPESAETTVYQSHMTAYSAVNHVRFHGAGYDSIKSGLPCFRITITATKLQEPNGTSIKTEG